ncbi:MAG: DUF192 domain-containing protein [Longimicrobiaceae bacterium]
MGPVDALRVVNRTRGSTLGDRVALADRWWLRMRGLLGRPPLAEGEGMLLTPCGAVHMRGMRYPLDVAILARDGRVVAVYPSLPPGGRTAWRHRGGHAALELPAGTLGSTGTAPGDVLAWSPAPPPPSRSPRA